MDQTSSITEAVAAPLKDAEFSYKTASWKFFSKRAIFIVGYILNHHSQGKKQVNEYLQTTISGD